MDRPGADADYVFHELTRSICPSCRRVLVVAQQNFGIDHNTVGYREQARAQLIAMEPERRRARREGRVHHPKPIAFDFENWRPI